VCKDCGGSGVCEHGRVRTQCKDCGGSGICKHGRVRGVCKDCGGGSICEHGRVRGVCKDCGGGSICEHGRERRRCKDCGGSDICEHGRVCYQCKVCRCARAVVDAQEKAAAALAAVPVAALEGETAAAEQCSCSGVESYRVYSGAFCLVSYFLIYNKQGGLRSLSSLMHARKKGNGGPNPSSGYGFSARLDGGLSYTQHTLLV
jgi:hypothetical protein